MNRRSDETFDNRNAYAQKQIADVRANLYFRRYIIKNKQNLNGDLFSNEYFVLNVLYISANYLYFSILEVAIFSSCRKNLYGARICRNNSAISKRKHGAAKFCLRKVLNRLPFFTRVITICYNPISLLSLSLSHSLVLALCHNVLQESCMRFTIHGYYVQKRFFHPSYIFCFLSFFFFFLFFAKQLKEHLVSRAIIRSDGDGLSREIEPPLLLNDRV